jgi:hypothetical protein
MHYKENNLSWCRSSESGNARDGCTRAIGAMRRIPLAGCAALFCVALVGAQPVAARDFAASLDFDYSYTQEHRGDDVIASATFNQKYELKYETALTTAFDFLGAVRLDLQDAWFTDGAGTSRLAPTLEMQVKGSQAAARLTYETSINTTDAFQESGEDKTASSALTFNVELTPRLWPEMKLSIQRRFDSEPFASERTASTVEFQARKDIYALRLEFNISLDQNDQTLPESQSSSSTTWSAKASYQEVLWRGTEFGLSYEINESRSVDETRGVFTAESQDYTQSFRTRLKNSFVIAPRITLGLGWEYEFEQDLLKQSYDYTFKNRYLLDLRWDFTGRLRLFAAATRETQHTEATVGEDDLGNLTDRLLGGFDYEMYPWLRFSGKAEFNWDSALAALTGGSVKQADSEKYELVASHSWSDFWDLTMNATSDIQREDGWLTSRTNTFKADLRLRWEDLLVSPSYEVSRGTQWEWGSDEPSQQTKTQDARINFEYVLELHDLLAAHFSHEYGVKVEETLDEVLNYKSTLQFNESTTLSIAMAEIIRDLNLEGSIQRTASDTEDDADPEIVDVSYTLDLGWASEELVIASSLKYNDKGDAFDDLSLNAKIGWRYERFALTGEYQFDKVYAEETQENRRLNLTLHYDF